LREVETINIHQHHRRPGYARQWHAHGRHSLLYVLAGTGRVYTGGTEYGLSGGSAVLLPPGTAHRIEDAPGAAMTVLSVQWRPEAMTGGQFGLKRLLPLMVEHVATAGHTRRQLERCLRKMLNEQHCQQPMWEVATFNLLVSILLLLRRGNGPYRSPNAYGRSSRQRVQEVMEHVKEGFYEPLSAASTAKAANLSVRQFANLVRQLYGQSFLSLVHGWRIERARQLLAETDLSVLTIAFQVGYNDLSTFYRAFERVAGMTPGKFRQQAKGEVLRASQDS